MLGLKVIEFYMLSNDEADRTLLHSPLKWFFSSNPSLTFFLHELYV